MSYTIVVVSCITYTVLNVRKLIFTAGRVCIAQTMPWQDVCLSVRPSVCLSHAGILSTLNGYTYPQSFFLQSRSPTILDFPYQTEWQYLGDPLTGCRMQGLRIANFRSNQISNRIGG